MLSNDIDTIKNLQRHSKNQNFSNIFFAIYTAFLNYNLLNIRLCLKKNKLTVICIAKSFSSEKTHPLDCIGAFTKTCEQKRPFVEEGDIILE